ncbi:alpha/beta fold hydrolase [Yaniella halotolerans]|uniref:alpha/beta fold hydrolase n=1 Tax=Yaniella halotolerans TaxID=225453 RepID=UPI0003B5764F|nr:alpha/beta hydrolase [Yaniella halotolerans]
MRPTTKHETPTMVFLHGVGLDHTMWAPVQAMLPDNAVYLDLPGHGTQPALHETTSLQALADDIAARLPDGLIQLVGFSLGGLIAQRLAIDLPDKILSVVAASTVCQRTEKERSSVQERLATAQRDFALSIQRSLERWYPATANVPTEHIEHTRAVLESNDVESFLYAYEVFATADQELASELGELHQPLLAITGELDPGSTPEMSHRLVNAVPNGTLQIVATARHMLPHEFPQKFVEHLKAHFAIEEVANS